MNNQFLIRTKQHFFEATVDGKKANLVRSEYKDVSQKSSIVYIKWTFESSGITPHTPNTDYIESQYQLALKGGADGN